MPLPATFARKGNCIVWRKLRKQIAVERELLRQHLASMTFEQEIECRRQRGEQFEPQPRWQRTR